MSFEIFWTPTALEHLEFWRKNSPEKIQKIKVLCRNIAMSPEIGLGKPEKLRFQQENIWSRRIDQEHRLVYKIKSNNTTFVLQCRYHYLT